MRATHLELFTMPNVADIRAHLLAQDVIWVGGGSVANLLAVWRAHGVDEVLRECWESGVVLGGVSAGSICWYVGGPTDSYGTDLRLSPPGLGLLPYGNGVHYDSEEQRRPLLHALVGKGDLPTSHATDDGVGLVYDGTELVEAVADRPGVAAYVVERQARRHGHRDPHRAAAAGLTAVAHELAVLGVPTSAGAHHAGQDLTPAALRDRGPRRAPGRGRRPCPRRR